MHQILFFVSIAAFVITTFLHGRGCLRFPEFGQHESNPLWKDKYGFFSLTKYIISLAVFFAVVVISHQFIEIAGEKAGWRIWLIVAIGAAGQFVFYLINSADAKKKRALQDQILDQLDEQAAAGNTNPTSPVMNAIFNPKLNGKPANPTVSKAGRVWYRLFPLLYVEGNNQEAAMVALREKVIAYAKGV